MILPCWLTSQDKYVIKNLIDDEFSYFQIHQSREHEDEYYWIFRKLTVCGYKILIEYDSPYLICIVNGCALNHFVGEFDNPEDEVRALNAKANKLKASIRAQVRQYQTQQIKYTQLTLI